MVLEVINQKKIKIKFYTLLCGFTQLLITLTKKPFFFKNELNPTKIFHNKYCMRKDKSNNWNFKNGFFVRT